jgi:hypothetical protein
MLLEELLCKLATDFVPDAQVVFAARSGLGFKIVLIDDVAERAHHNLPTRSHHTICVHLVMTARFQAG